jgi:hypothetical protein
LGYFEGSHWVGTFVKTKSVGVHLWSVFSRVFCWQLSIGRCKKKVAIVLLEDLAKFDYKPNMKHKILIILLFFWATHWNPNIKIQWFLFLFSNFWQFKTSKITSFFYFHFPFLAKISYWYH